MVLAAMKHMWARWEPLLSLENCSHKNLKGSPILISSSIIPTNKNGGIVILERFFFFFFFPFLRQVNSLKSLKKKKPVSSQTAPEESNKPNKVLHKLSNQPLLS